MPKACPYVMMPPSPIVADIMHRICEGKRNWGIFFGNDIHVVPKKMR